MAIDPALATGLNAYRRGEWGAAARAWSTAPELGGDDERLRRALVTLAELLDAAEAGRLAEAGRRLDGLQTELDGLEGPCLGIDVDRLRGGLLVPVERVLAAPPEIVRFSRLPEGSARFLLFVAGLAAVGVAVVFTPLGDLITKENVVALFAELRDTWWSPFVLLGAYLVAAPIGLPMTPLIVAGGVVFGARFGALYNTIGTVVGAWVSYELARLLGRDFVVQIAGEKLQRFERQLARMGFWPLAGVRFLPVPFPVVNFGAALAGVRRPTFLATSLIGLTPAMVVYTFLFAKLFEIAEGGGSFHQKAQIGLVFLLVFALTLSPVLVRGWRRKRRLRELRGRRRGRGA